MYRKLFFKVFFEKKKIMLYFFVICMLLVFYVSLQTIFSSNEAEAQSSVPDLVFTGTVYQSEDGSYPFTAYNSIEGFINKIREISGDDMDSYPLVCRSLYNYYDELTSIGFSGFVYGMPDECISNYIAPYLSKGRLPETGKKEAVIGYYFAQRFDIDIGETIPQAITLSEQWTDDDIDTYIVSGILKENVSGYYNGSTIISRDTWNSFGLESEDNMIIAYFDSGIEDSRSEEIFLEINGIAKDYRSPEGRMNYLNKTYSKRQIIVSFTFNMLISFLLIFVLASYAMKGITPKIGLLKATGMSPKTILGTFLLGVFLIVLVSSMCGVGLTTLAIFFMNQYVSEFYGFTVVQYSFNNWTFIMIGLEMLILTLSLFIILGVKCLRISPKIAMTKSI